jgi:putative hydrolase of the HAD superfamily
VYYALEGLGVTARDTWMIGDNLEWEVLTRQRLGIYAIWMDVHSEGLPVGPPTKSDRIIHLSAELLPQRT